MKTKLPHFLLPIVLLFEAVLVASCATGPSASTVSLLGAAGFRVRTPETPEQKEIFAKLPSYKVEEITVKGHKYFVYKDGGKGLALVGQEAEYQRYREMARQERQSASYETAVLANAAEVETWHGASGSDWW
ncbi:MAG: hypothetical protein ACJ8HQ_01370 [Chthoniobacterales bacterium]